MRGIYDAAGYLNVEGLLVQPFTFNFLIGGRGTGKTYGILKYILDHNLKVFFIRRQQTQVDIISKPEFNPFKVLDPAIEVKPASKYHSLFFRDGVDIGYCAALSTFSKIRGFDASDIDIIFYDEFIPELHERPIKNEAEALFNAYETVNRNRELQGRDPVKLVCAANSNRIDNPVLMGFGLLKRVEKMYKSGSEIYKDPERSILMIVSQHSPISEQKEDTALYTALHGSKFNKMALENRFSFSEDLIASKDIKNYKILFKIGSIGFYSSRQKALDFYIRETKEDAAAVYEDSVDGIKKLKIEKPWLLIWESKGFIKYENLDVFTRFRELLTK